MFLLHGRLSINILDYSIILKKLKITASIFCIFAMIPTVFDQTGI